MDFSSLEQYRENNRLEAKKAAGGLPASLWETYSAFANTRGGVILLGVEELPDHTLHPSGLSNPEKLIHDLWNHLHNRQKVSVNLLSERHVRIEEAEGVRIVVIKVPRAQRYDRPVYVGGNPATGTFRRNGDGDYHCSPEEYRAMVRDASPAQEDLRALEELDLSAFCPESVRGYRVRMANARPGHVWENLDDREFLTRIGAARMGEDGNLHPTAAGLVMFGWEYEIVREYPRFLLDYREIPDFLENADASERWTDRLLSSSGDWSGNVFDFFFRIYGKLTRDLKVPFRLEGIVRIDDTPLHKAVREALANCVVNADYSGGNGIVALKYQDRLELSNPGGFRIELEEAKSGGMSDPRNAAMMKMFTLINIGERAGSGIPSIYRAWKEQGWPEPEFRETVNPERVTLVLPLASAGESEAERYFREALQMAQQGRTEDAERLFRKAVELRSRISAGNSANVNGSGTSVN